MTNTYYTILPADVRYDKRLLANEKIIYSEILALAQKKGYCHATNAYFAEALSTSVTSVSKWINKLIKLSYIRAEYKYRENTKCIEERRLFVNDLGNEEPTSNLKEDMKEDLKGPLEENLGEGLEGDFKDNKTSINNTSMNKTKTPLDIWNGLGGKIAKISDSSKYQARLDFLIKTYGEEDLISTIKSIDKSKFLKGEVGDFVISFTYFLNNYEKIRSGAYDDWAKGKARKKLGKFSKSQAEDPFLAQLARARRLARMKSTGNLAPSAF